MKLSLERLFSAPALEGSSPQGLQFSPDGTRLTYLSAKNSRNDSQADALDLWQFELATGEKSVIASANQFDAREFSIEEKARRERLRLSHEGITEYYWAPNSQSILVPLAGNLYLLQLNVNSVLPVTDNATYETDIRFSPNSQQLAFIRDRTLHVMQIPEQLPGKGAEISVDRVLPEGTEELSYGLPEFIAQEEMHRYEGYWWSPSSDAIAFIRVDETPVEISERYEIEADSFSVFAQRYPFAGTPNADVALGVVELTTGHVLWIDVTQHDDDYIARVHWLSPKKIMVLVQDRRQQTLSYVLVEISFDNRETRTSVIMTEQCETWINLSNSFKSLADERFVFGSERSGFHHLWLGDTKGHVAPVTEGHWQVTSLVGVRDDIVYFEALADGPFENHLYRVPISGGQPERLSQEGFTHSTTLRGQHVVDRYSAVGQPPRVEILDLDTSLKHIITDEVSETTHPFHQYQSEIGPVEFGVLTAEDGQSLPWRLLRPVGVSSSILCPVIVVVYGGPGVRRVNNEWLTPWHHYMTSQGYAIFQLDNRGSTDRGRDFESPIYGHLGDIEVRDQLLGVQYLQSLDEIDSNRIGVFGHSYGGYMTLMLLMKSPGTFKCGISVAPVTDWGLYDTHYTERYLGLPSDNKAGYEASSVFPYTSALSDPLLLIHGMADDNVLFTHTTRLYKDLQDQGLMFETMAYPGAKHGITGRSTNIHRYRMMDHFLTRYLMDTTR